ncbi:MAG: hypothetical protein JXA52_08980 [Planctomycetes bacterium]|nr:hypothetical protein [Planctomycetota bacterium]
MKRHKRIILSVITAIFMLSTLSCRALDQEWSTDPTLQEYHKGKPLEHPAKGEDERREGYIRKEFEIPEGKIWKAVADVGSANFRTWNRIKMVSAFYLNGQLVERPLPPERMYCLQPVDITPYVKSGKNCAAFYGYRPKPYPPYIIAQIRIIMEDGSIIDLNTDETWKTSPDEAEGWNQPGFDDSAWQNIGIWGYDISGVIRQHQHPVPSYRGYLEMRNPQRRDLIYRNTDNIELEVMIPPGIRKIAQRVEYLFSRENPDGTSELINTQEVDFLKPTPLDTADQSLQEQSVVCRLNLGKQTDGIYTIALRLIDWSGNIIDEREREIIMVLGKVEQKYIDATDYYDGLDLELEDIVDFTDPNDPHPWFESMAVKSGEAMEKITEPKIIRKENGLVYREVTGTLRSSVFSYRIEFQHPGDFYLLELEYPDDAERVINVSISSKLEHVWSNSQSGTGAETGGKYYKTDTMQKLKWIHTADSGVHSIDIHNYMNDWPAAAKSLKIYHIKGNLPAVKAGRSRDFGIHTERCYSTSAIGMSFGVNGQRRGDTDSTITPTARRDDSLIQRTIQQMHWTKATSERYVQYLRFTGQNMHLMGCIQYHEGYNPFLPVDPNSKSPRIINCMKTILANILDVNNMGSVTGIQFSMPVSLKTYATDEEVAAGADTMWYVNAKGEQRNQRMLDRTNVANFQHPYFRQTYFTIVRDMANTYGHIKNYMGVSNFSSPTGHPTSYYFPGYSPGRGREVWQTPLDWSYDDITFSNFFDDTGIDLKFESNDPERFGKRATAIAQDETLRQNFLDWRCQKLKEFFDEAVEILTAERDDLQFINVMAHIETREAYQELMESGQTFAQMMKTFGLDIKLLSEVKNSTLVRWTMNWRQSYDHPSQNPYMWIPKEREVVVGAFAGLPSTGVLCRTSWDENAVISPGHPYLSSHGVSPGTYVNILEGSDWIMDAYKTRVEVQPPAYHARETLTQAIITGDPQIILSGYTDLALNIGNEHVQREVMVQFTNLPAEKFEQVLDTDLTTNLTIRKLSKGDESWMYIANPGYYHIAGTVEIDAGGTLSELVSGKRVADAGKITLPVELAPFAMMAYKVDSGKLEIASYQTGEITAHEISHMTNVMDRAKKLRPDDEFTTKTIAEANKAIGEGEYAAAWSLIKDYRFWPTY